MGFGLVPCRKDATCRLLPSIQRTRLYEFAWCVYNVMEIENRDRIDVQISFSWSGSFCKPQLGTTRMVKRCFGIYLGVLKPHANRMWGLSVLRKDLLCVRENLICTFALCWNSWQRQRHTPHETDTYKQDESIFAGTEFFKENLVWTLSFVSTSCVCCVWTCPPHLKTEKGKSGGDCTSLLGIISYIVYNAAKHYAQGASSLTLYLQICQEEHSTKHITTSTRTNRMGTHRVTIPHKT